MMAHNLSANEIHSQAKFVADSQDGHDQEEDLRLKAVDCDEDNVDATKNITTTTNEGDNQLRRMSSGHDRDQKQ